MFYFRYVEFNIDLSNQEQENVEIISARIWKVKLSMSGNAMEVKALWAEMLTALLQHNNRKARVKDGQLCTIKCQLRSPFIWTLLIIWRIVKLSL